MKVLIVDKKNKNNYSLKDDSNYIYNLNITFYDLDLEIDVGDIIGFDEKHLNDKVLSFGPLTESYGKKLTRENIYDEIIVIKTGDKKYFLKRFYG